MNPIDLYAVPVATYAAERVADASSVRHRQRPVAESATPSSGPSARIGERVLAHAAMAMKVGYLSVLRKSGLPIRLMSGAGSVTKSRNSISAPALSTVAVRTS